MSKSLKAILCFVMASALALMVFCFLHYLSLGRELGSFRQQLAESRETWEKTAAEKEVLQDELKEVRKKLNIANLELEQSTADADEIKAEIEQLREEIEFLKHNQSGGS